MASKRATNKVEAKPAEPAQAAQPTSTPATPGNDDGRVARLEKKVDSLHKLLHEHGIRHKE